MRVEDLTLKNLKKENDYLLEIIKSNLKKKGFETEEEKDKFIDEEEQKAKKSDEYISYLIKNDKVDMDKATDLQKEIMEEENYNIIFKLIIKNNFLDDSTSDLIDIDALIRGKVFAKNTARTGKNVGKKIGRGFMKAAKDVYNNRDKYAEKMKDKIEEAVENAEKQKEKYEQEVERYERTFKNKYKEELKEIVLDENNKHSMRRAAKNVYDSKHKKKGQ